MVVLTDGIIEQDNTKGKSDFQKYIGQNIDKTDSGRFRVRKVIDGKTVYFGTYDTLDEAVTIRDRLAVCGWDKSIIRTEDDLIQEYYSRIHRNGDYCFEVRRPKNNKKGLPRYMGVCHSIEEALYYRDIAKKNDYIIGKPSEYDLITDNPYLKNGLKYPLPKRLQKTKNRKESTYGTGYCKKSGPNSYQVWYNKKYYGSYTTKEYAEYIRLKLNENQWDISKLDEIKKAYPEYYTKLLYFWRYIKYDEKHDSWRCSKTLSKDNIVRFTFNKPEDALYERDLYEKYNWNMDDVVELADDTYNKYYDMTLPPYPTRQKRAKYGVKEDYKEIIEDMAFFVEEFDITTWDGICETLNLSTHKLNSILKKYNTSWIDFKNIVFSGENPLEVLTFNDIIEPDLTPKKSKTDYIYYDKSRKYTPWLVTKDNIFYGRYSSKRIASKIVTRLKKCNWDKEELPRIREEIGYISPSRKGETSKLIYMDKRNPKNIRYYIRHLSTYYGAYDTRETAEKVVNELEKVDWDKKQLPFIKDKLGVLKI